MNIQEKNLDHIYKVIHISPEFYSFLNNRKIIKEINRLEHLQQIPEIQLTYPLAIHSRLEHCLGTYHLSNIATEKITGLSSNGINTKALKISAILHGIGHFPYGYSAEKAYMNAMEISNDLQSAFMTMVKEITDFVGCPRCQKVSARKHNKEFTYTLINRWFAANKIKGLQDVIKKNGGVDAQEICRYFTCPHSNGYFLLKYLDKLDFVVRDTFHIGEMKIELPYEDMVAGITFDKGKIVLPPFWDVIRFISQYLEKNIYTMPEVISARSFLSLYFLNGFLGKCLDTMELTKITDGRIRGRGYPPKFDKPKYFNKKFDLVEFLNYIRNNNIKCIFRLSQRNYFEDIQLTELSLAGCRKQNFYDMCSSNGVFLRIERMKELFPTFNIEIPRLHGYITIDREKGCLSKAFDILSKGLNRGLMSEKHPVQHIAEFLFNGKVTDSFEKYRPILEKYCTDLLKTDHFKGKTESLFSENFRKTEEYDLFSKQLSLKQIIYYSHYQPQNLSYTFLEQLKKKLQKCRKNREKAKELTFFFDEILQFKGKTLWVLPGLNITIPERGKNYEIDMFAVKLTSGVRPLLIMREISISTTQSKKSEDIKKLQEIQYFLKTNFKNRIKVRMFFNKEEINNV